MNVDTKRSFDTTKIEDKNRLRRKTLNSIGLTVAVFILVSVAGLLIDSNTISTDFDAKNAAPGLTHLFGTDWLGRDLFLRTIKGLSLSIGIGLLAAGLGVVIAVVLGLLSATMGKIVDTVICFVVDLFLSVPHLLVIILVSFALGGGAKGVIIGVAVTHWTSLTRIVRAEVLQILTNDYVHIARQMGKSRLNIAIRHVLPHLAAQVLVGFVSTFPHAILHEATATFLGFGLAPHEPAIGIILSESMRYIISGYWWLAVLPGLSLLIMVLLFDMSGDKLGKLINPNSMRG